MKCCAILLCCFLWGAVPVLASPLGADSFFTVDIPEGWTIEAQDKGSVTMLSPDAGIMVSLVTGLNGARSRADIVEEYRKMLDAPDVRPRADDVYEMQGHAGNIPMRGVLALGADRHVLVLLAGKVDDAQAQAEDYLALVGGRGSDIVSGHKEGAQHQAAREQLHDGVPASDQGQDSHSGQISNRDDRANDLGSD